MAYIGRGIDNISQIEVLDLITFTDSAGPYNILKGAVAFIPSTVNSLLIEVDGIIQAPASYTIDGSTITFGASMASTSTMNSMIHFGTGLITTPADGTVSTVKLEDGAVTGAKVNSTFDVSAKTVTLPASVSGLGTGITNAQLAGSIDVTSKITGVVPTANLGSGSASSSTYLAGDQTYKALSEYDDNQVQSNIAMLGFKVATNGSLVKYSLVDQAIDDFNDASGIDAANSTNESRAGSTGAFYFAGGSAPTITQDADDSGVDGDYTWYKWTDTGATGSYSISTAVTHEFLVVAGGGGGGALRGGGGGAGGLRSSYGSVSGGGAGAQADLDFGASTTYTITVGAGGAGEVGSGGSGQAGDDGSASSITGSDIDNVTTVGGGGGLGNSTASSGSGGTRSGGSGGGRTDNQNTSAATGTSGEGYAGAAFSTGNSGAGGGAAAAGGTGGTVAGIGGAGLDITITGSSVGYAGGGGGGANDANTGTASHGGGTGGVTGVVKATSGTANTGGGGGGAYDATDYEGGDGGSGIVVLRRLTSAGSTAGQDLTLQSVDTTAGTAPSYGEFVTLIENAYGTATLNTDIKGYISRDSGTTFTQGTLVDEGTWGTNKKILGFHDLDISAQPSGVAMCYKITTHNQSASSKETRIYATSIGWR